MTAPFTYDEARCIDACEHIARRIVQPLVRRCYGAANAEIGAKADRSLATAADLAIEREVRDFLAREFAGFGVIGEELGATSSDREYVWTIDPIDGTEAFVAGVPLFGTLLAVVRQAGDGTRTPLLGAIYLPVQDRLIVGNRVRTTLDGQPVRMPPAVPVEQSALILGDIAKIAQKMPARAQARLLGLARRFRSAQTWGDCLGYLSLLEGRAQARVEANLGVDDVAPLEPVILGAGGCVSTGDGAPFSRALSALHDLADPNASFVSVCAGSEALHAEIVAVLKAS